MWFMAASAPPEPRSKICRLTASPENGYDRVGPNVAGRFVKMVHNGIEYGMMQACAESFGILEWSPHGLELKQAGKIWQHAGVVRPWLLDFAVSALENDPKLEGLEAWVTDSGKGSWTIETAMDEGVPAPVIAFALFSRLYSRPELLLVADAGRAAQRVRRPRRARREPVVPIKERPVPLRTMVIVGASRDLAQHRLIPALCRARPLFTHFAGRDANSLHAGC